MDQLGSHDIAEGYLGRGRIDPARRDVPRLDDFNVFSMNLILRITLGTQVRLPSLSLR